MTPCASPTFVASQWRLEESICIVNVYRVPVMGLQEPNKKDTWTTSRTAASPVTNPHSAKELARPATVPSCVTQRLPHEKNASRKHSPAQQMCTKG